MVITDKRAASVRWPQVTDLDEAMRLAHELGDSPTACLLCEGERLERLFRRFDKWFWTCRSCDLVFVHDIYPEFVNGTDQMGHRGPGGLGTAESRRHARFAQRIRELERYRETGRFLEVGCGQGLFLEHVREAGWDVRGVDTSAADAHVARERGLDVVASEIFDAAFEDASFDVAYMSEVIEHVVDPVSLMEELRRVLRPGGVAIVHTGNVRSWTARLRGGRWWYYAFCGQGHIRFYSPRAAKALARRAGFDSVECRTSGFALRESDELRGRWYKPAVKLGQNLLSPFAGPAGAGHRLTMTFRRAD